MDRSPFTLIVMVMSPCRLLLNAVSSAIVLSNILFDSECGVHKTMDQECVSVLFARLFLPTSICFVHGGGESLELSRVSETKALSN